jgi:3-dehydroquinate synthase
VTPLSQRKRAAGRQADVSVHGFTLDYSFPVYFTEDVWDAANTTLLEAITRLETDRRHRVMVVVDSNVAAAIPSIARDISGYALAWRQWIELACDPVLLPGGETSKNALRPVFRLLNRMNDIGLDRQSFVIAVGGGAVLDAASFAAAICHRSVRTIRVPTTVLSQCDSGIAVKNGVNLFGKKNFIGTFVPPFAVINDSRYLETLPRREQVAGLAEVVKVALLRDAALFEYLETHAAALTNAQPGPLAYVTRRSAELHLAHICGSGDPFEFGSARPLDFGHWAAHKLESMTAHRLRHGEAVAIGMALDLLYAVRAGHLDAACAGRILDLLEALGFTLWDDALRHRERDGQLTVLRGLQEFREHLGGRLHVTLLRRIGDRFEVTEMDEPLVAAALGELEARHGRRAAAR